MRPRLPTGRPGTRWMRRSNTDASSTRSSPRWARAPAEQLKTAGAAKRRESPSTGRPLAGVGALADGLLEWS
jgi:hypothetical protein